MKKFAITHPMTASNTKRILPGVINGPEHVLERPGSRSADGSSWDLWTAAKNGSVYSMRIDGADVVAGSVKEEVYAGPGRVLGFTWDGSGGVYLCNAVQVRGWLHAVACVLLQYWNHELLHVGAMRFRTCAEQLPNRARTPLLIVFVVV